MDKASVKDLKSRIRELEEEIVSVKRHSEKEIKESFAKYRRVLDATSEGYLELDLDFNIVDCNTTIVKLIGKQGESLLNRPVESLYDKQSVFIHFASKDHLSFEADFDSPKGEHLPLLFKRSVLRGKDGKPNGYLVFFTNLTELKKAQEDLEQAETRYRDIYKNAAQGMYQTTLDGRFIRINPAFAKTFGYEQTTQLLFHPMGVISLYKDPVNREQFIAALQKHKVLTDYEVEMQDREGKPVWAMINARLSSDGHGATIIEGILIDNTKKRLAEDKLRRSSERFRYLANHDSLTGLFNTRYLYKALDRLIIESKENNQPFSLVFLDMDNFKQVVDTYGHLNGSQALREVAGTFKSGLSEPSFGVAYGGDEFVLVFPETGKEAVLEHAQKIRFLMKETVYLTKQDLQVHLAASFGVATFPEDAIDREGLLALADEAMFHIKSRGKDAVGVIAENQKDSLSG